MHCIPKNNTKAFLLLRHCGSARCQKLKNLSAVYHRLFSSSSSVCSFQNHGQPSSGLTDRKQSKPLLCSSPLLSSGSRLCLGGVKPQFSSQSHNYSTFSDFLSKFSTVNAAEVMDEAKTTAAGPVVSENIAEKISSSPAIDPAIEYIPIPPSPLPEGIDPSSLNILGEPSMTSLGLGGWSPVGIFINTLEAVHCHTGLPWWGSIALITVCLRMLLFPLVVISQKNAAALNNISPQMQALQTKITDARQSGDQLMVARYSQELVQFMKEKQVNPIKSAVVPLVQAPIFISVFIGLRRCATLPVVSMATGGMLWFTDLTIADPNYLLPILTCATMSATIELGTEAGRMNVMTESAKIMFQVVRFMPLICLPFMINFPSALLVYWFTTNGCSLVQAGVLKIPIVRRYFEIEQIVKHNPDTLPLTKKQKSKSTIQAAKDSWRDMKVVRELEDRQRYDEMKFAQAGTGPVQRTFKFDPTKVKDRKKNPPIEVKAKVKS